jgi:hypothetical protein
MQIRSDVVGSVLRVEYLVEARRWPSSGATKSRFELDEMCYV